MLLGIVCSSPLAGAQAQPSSCRAGSDLGKKALERRLDQAEAARDQAQTGKLMANGITIGAGLAIQTPPPWRAEARQEGLEVVAMPYVIVLPGYWGTPQSIREYCAAAWTGGDEDSAANAATAIAKKSASRTARAIKTALKLGQSGTQIQQQLLSQYTEVNSLLIISRMKEVLAVEQSDPAAALCLQSEAEDQLAQWEWNPTLRGKCGWRQLGFWLGLPLDYETSARVDGATAERKLDSVVAGGLTYTPGAFFSFLLGVGHVVIEDPSAERRSWTGTLGIGGNLDLLGQVFK